MVYASPGSGLTRPINENLARGQVDTKLGPGSVNTNWKPVPGSGAKKRAEGWEIHK